MECADTVLIIASYLTKRDLVAVSGVSRLCQRVVTDALISNEEKRYLVWPCLKEDYVELAPPSQILALGVLEKEQRLLVLVRAGTETSNPEEIECYLYTQLVDEDGAVKALQRELPICFALPTSLAHFTGNRFLVCTTREGELHVFDCLIEAMLEMPVGIDGFYASPGGERFLLDYDRHAYLCCTTSHVVCWWEMRHVEPKEQSGEAFRIGARAAPATLVEAQLRAQVCPLPAGRHGRDASTTAAAASLPSSSSSTPPPLQFFLGNSSAAWHGFWLGGNSALYANEEGVSLLKVDAAADASVVAEELPSLSPVSAAIVDSSCGDVVCTSIHERPHDEYAVINCREAHLYTVCYHSPCPVEVQTVDLARILPPRAAIKSVRIAVTRCTYLLYVQQCAQDRVLLFSSDLTLTRWIAIGRPSCFVLWRQQASLVLAHLSEDRGESHHPLVEAVEGGLGCVYTFGMRLPDAAATTATAADPFVSAVKASSAAAGTGEEAGEYRFGAMPQPFNGVEALSWIALGVVSASLLWTVSALCYNGWWLHLQLLFWGKVT